MTIASFDGWNHNRHYHSMLLSTVPSPCRRALDVGCGLGTFARRLAAVSERVDALDREPGILSRARSDSSGVANLRFIEADFRTWQPDGVYDYVAMIATLHHLPFDETLTKVASLLQPRGVLGVLGLHRERSPIQSAAWSAVAFPISLAYRLTRRTASVEAPIREPAMTLDEIRRAAAARLPGVVVRRHLLWRHSLVWTKPA